MERRVPKCSQIAARFIANATDKHLVVGPVLDKRYVVCGADTDGFWNVVIEGDEANQADLLLDIMQRNRGFVVQVCADQLDAAEMCRELWPCDRTNEIAESIRASRSTKN